LPADVCGEVTKPISSRSAMMLRIVAGLKSSPESRDSVRDPTGCPSRMYLSTSTRSRCCARSSGKSPLLTAMILGCAAANLAAGRATPCKSPDLREVQGSHGVPPLSRSGCRRWGLAHPLSRPGKPALSADEHAPPRLPLQSATGGAFQHRMKYAFE